MNDQEYSQATVLREAIRVLKRQLSTAKGYLTEDIVYLTYYPTTFPGYQDSHSESIPNVPVLVSSVVEHIKLHIAGLEEELAKKEAELLAL